MTASTKLEKQIVLKIFKDFAVDYNPSSISKILGKSRIGAFKSLNSLEEDLIVKGKDMGKARFYRINFKDEYAKKNVETLLMEEAKPFERWREEFIEMFEYVEIVILFGSILREEGKARDIDLLIVLNKKNNDKIDEFIRKKNRLLIQKIHPIKQTIDDIKKNIGKEDKVITDAIKSGIVLKGYEKFVELIKDASSRKQG